MPTLIDNTSVFLNDLDYANMSAADQALVNGLIEVSSELIEKECNRIFLADDFTDELNGDNLNSIFVKNIPINSLTSITIHPDLSSFSTEYLDDWLYTWITNVTEDIVYPDADHTIDELFGFNEKTGEVWFKSLSTLTTPPTTYLGYFPFGRQNVSITYNGGFSPEVPTPIQKLCADLVMASFSPDNAAGNIDSEKLGQYFYKTRKDAVNELLSSNKRIISLYKIRKV